MLVPEPIDDVSAEVLDYLQQICGVLFTDSANAFVYDLCAQPRTPLDMIGGLRPGITQGEAEGIDTVLVMTGGFRDLVPARPHWDHAELQRGIVSVLEAAVDAQSGRPRITQVTIDDLEQPLDFGHGYVMASKPPVPRPLL
jgi:hypothetical protein